MTEIQRLDGSTWVDIRYQDFEIEYGLSDVLIAPKATVDTDVRETVNSGEQLRIREDGTTIFQGRLTSSGKRRSNGGRRLEAEHRAYELFEENVSFTSVSPTASDVLTDALAASNIGGSFTLTFAASDVILADDYTADNRPLKRVFRDITDRTGTVWWVAGAADEITVDTYGGRGLWESITTATDTARVLSYDPDNIETVVNDVTVNGTGGERVTGTATDSTSISTYGRRSQTVNVSYITSQTEADDYASALLKPDPLPEAELLVGGNVGTDPESNLSNYEVAVDDSNGTGLNDTLVVEKQTVEQGQVRLDLGEGRATSVAKFNRSSKSKDDTTEPGSVYNSDRIADGAVGDTELVDLSVTEQKLADLAVSLNKLQDNAVVEGKLADLSVSETKVQDDAISTPKLQAEAVVAAKIDANTITANEIASGTITAFEIQSGTITAQQIDANTISANEIAAGTLTANEIDTLDLDTNQLTIGQSLDSGFEFDQITDLGETVGRLLPTNVASSASQIGSETKPIRTFEGQIYWVQTQIAPRTDNTGLLGLPTSAWDDVWAYDYYDANTGTTINDGGDPLEGLANDPTPPDHCQSDRGEGVSINKLAKTAYELCSAQQRRIEDLESRIESLEAAVSE